jgi:hypothetical protein
MIVTPLLDVNPQTGEPLNYGAFADDLEQKIRVLERPDRYPHRRLRQGGRRPDRRSARGHDVLRRVGGVAAVFVYLYTRCLRSTVLLVTVAVIGVVWLLGLMQLLGYELDPYSILVPFLIFAIGLSHGAQKMNGIIRTSGVAPTNTWRRATPSGACSWPG